MSATNDQPPKEVVFPGNKYAGVIGSDQYIGVHDTSISWPGELNREFNSIDALTAGSLDPWKTCAYRFRLYAWSRVTDGFHYIRDASFNDHYYIQVEECVLCRKTILPMR